MRRIGLIVLLAGASLGIGCSGSDPAASQQMPPTPVKIQTEQMVPVVDSSEYVASLKSRNSTTLSPQVEGQVTKIFVKSGDHVAAGAVMMQIDPLKQEATVGSQQATRAAKVANVRYAEQQLERTRSLYQSGVTSKQALDQDQSAYDSAKAELAALDANVTEQQVQLHYYRVIAPTSGVVGDIPVHVGDRVTLTTALTTVDQPGSLEAYVEVPVERAPGLKLNQPVQLLDEAGNVMAESHVTFISPRVDDQAQTILVKAAVDNRKGQLRTAQFVRARVIWGSRQGLVIPVLAVSRINGMFFVYVAEGSDKSLVAHQKQVRLGDIVGNNYVVLDGLKAGDRVVVSGSQNLIDGAPVTPQG